MAGRTELIKGFASADSYEAYSHWKRHENDQTCQRCLHTVRAINRLTFIFILFLARNYTQFTSGSSIVDIILPYLTPQKARKIYKRYTTGDLQEKGATEETFVNQLVADFPTLSTDDRFPEYVKALCAENVHSFQAIYGIGGCTLYYILKQLYYASLPSLRLRSLFNDRAGNRFVHLAYHLNGELLLPPEAVYKKWEGTLESVELSTLFSLLEYAVKKNLEKPECSSSGGSP